MSTHQEVAELAYRLWPARGRLEGTHDVESPAADHQHAISNTPGEDVQSDYSSSMDAQGGSEFHAAKKLEAGV
jgi:hypothetical protein